MKNLVGRHRSPVSYAVGGLRVYHHNRAYFFSVHAGKGVPERSAFSARKRRTIERA